MSAANPDPTPEQNEANSARVYPADPAAAAAAAPVETSGEGVAERYVAQELRDTRASLRRTQIFSSLLALGVIGYTSYVTSTLNRALEPRAAAEIAQGVVATQIEQQGPVLVQELEQRIPALIAELPDYALREMPQYRESLERQIEQDMERHFQANSKELGDTFDELLVANKDNIQRMMETGQDPDATREVGKALEGEMMEFLSQTPTTGGETATSKINQSLTALRQVEQRMERLANAKNLTPQEKQARRAIALLSQQIEEKRGDGSVPSLPTTPDPT